MTNDFKPSGMLEDRIYGCLLGGLIGDAMGAPAESRTFHWIAQEYGAQGITTFEGVGTDDTAIREQLIDAILDGGGFVHCDSFAQSFLRYHQKNYDKWWVPVRNAYHKIQSRVVLPVDAGWGNTPSSSSAMAISPIGILNAARPRQAALEAFDVASFLHSGPSGFCRDAACAMAAAVAAAFDPQATVKSIVDSATAYLHPLSAQVITQSIKETGAIARDAGGYESFRADFYASMLREEQCDSRETVPVALALFELSDGDPRDAILRGANFGRDADTIATMVGGLCGAFHGASGMPQDWLDRIIPDMRIRYGEMTRKLAAIVQKRGLDAAEYSRVIEGLGQLSSPD